MSKTLNMGDLIWYNVGGRGYETLGLVIETADLWTTADSWEIDNTLSAAKKYPNCVRVQWMRVGRLKPRAISMPMYRKVVKYSYKQALRQWDELSHWERDAIMPQFDQIVEGNWYHPHYFKKLTC